MANIYQPKNKAEKDEVVEYIRKKQYLHVSKKNTGEFVNKASVFVLRGEELFFISKESKFGGETTIIPALCDFEKQKKLALLN